MTGLFSCKQSNESATKIGATEISESNKHIQGEKAFNDTDIYTKYLYANSEDQRIIQNGFPRGVNKYRDKKGNNYNYAIFWTEIINETDKPVEVKINIPLDSYEIPSLPGKYYKVLIPADTMTIKKFPLINYGLTNLESFLDNNINKSASLKRTINPKQSNGVYVVILCLSEGAHGTMRPELSLKGQKLF